MADWILKNNPTVYIKTHLKFSDTGRLKVKDGKNKP